MPSAKEQIDIPSKVKYYAYTKVFLPIFLLSIFVSMSGNTSWFSILFPMLIFIDLPVCIYISILFSSISFTVEGGKITIYSGIFIKRMKIIPLDKIQNVNCVRGPLMQMFGVSGINIWTASPEQLSLGKKGNEHTPDGSLVLTDDLTEWLQEFITRK